MSRQNLIAILKKYKKAGRASTLRRAYLRAFEEKMMYRTTKTENPSTTRQMVAQVLRKFR